MTEFVKKSLHSTMKSNKFTFYSHETQVIMLITQLALYATFMLNGEVKEHFIGLIPISIVVGTHMSVANTRQPWKF